MMTDERIIDELAKVDGIFVTTHRRNFPDYLNSHDALQPLIDGMDIDSTRTDRCSTYRSYYMYLASVVQCPEVLKATPRQKAEAILKVYGKWCDS